VSLRRSADRSLIKQFLGSLCDGSLRKSGFVEAVGLRYNAAMPGAGLALSTHGSNAVGERGTYTQMPRAAQTPPAMIKAPPTRCAGPIGSFKSRYPKRAPYSGKVL
jgi:hypothetical protein